MHPSSKTTKQTHELCWILVQISKYCWTGTQHDSWLFSRYRTGFPPSFSVSRRILVYHLHGFWPVKLEPERDRRAWKARPEVVSIFGAQNWLLASIQYQAPSCRCTLKISEDWKWRYAIKSWRVRPNDFRRCYVKRQTVRFEEKRRKILLAHETR